MSKKLLSILLCVLMVITSISCLFTMSASAVGILNKELISYGNVDDLGDDAPVKLNSLQSTNLSDVAAKHANKWYRASGGVALGTDLDSTGAVWTIDSSETFPTQFGANAQVVVDPTNANNKALRVVQNLHQFIDADEIVSGDTYTLKFDYINRGTDELNSNEKYIVAALATPNGDDAGKVGVNFAQPFGILDASLNVVSKTDANLAVGATGTGIKFTFGSNNTDTWQSVTVKFTLGDEDTTLYNTAIEDKLLVLSFLQTVSLTDGKDDHAVYYDNISLTRDSVVTGSPEFYNIDGEKIESNDYAGINVVGNADGSVTATVDYDKAAGVVKFIGWYNGNEVVSYNEALTFTYDANVTYVPRFLTYNMLATSGSFENIESGTVLRYTEAYPGDNAPNYPEGNLWGLVAAQGYITYPTNEDGELLTSNNDAYYITTYTESVYDVQGNKYDLLKQASPRTAKSWLANTQKMKVNETVAKNGTKSLTVGNGEVASVLGINVKPNTTYELSYYANVTASKSNRAFSSGIMTTVNMGNTYTTDDANINSVYDVQIPNYFFNAKNFATTDYNNKTVSYVSSFTYGGEAGKAVFTTPTNGWTKVTHTFTTGANLNNNKVYLVVHNSTGAEAYIDDLTCYAPEEIPSFIGNPKVYKTDAVTEIPNANLNIAVDISGAEVPGSQITATVKYDAEDTTLKFLGWYNGNDLVTKESTITAVIANGDNFYPKFVTTNLMAAAGSYEYCYNGQDVGYIPETPTETDEAGNLVAPEFGNGFGWGYHYNGGFISSNGTSTYDQNVYADTLYHVDGTTETVAQVKGTRAASHVAGYPSYITTDMAHSGTKSLAIKANIARSISIPVKSGSTYNLSFWAYLEEGSKFYYAVSTEANIGSYSGGYGLAHLAQGNSKLTQFILSKGNSTECGAWNKYKLEFTVPANCDIDTVYLVINNSQSVWNYLDDFLCYEVVDNAISNIKFIDTDGNSVDADVNNFVSAELVNNLDGTSTATVNFNDDNNAYIFEGWYDSENAVISTDKEFTFNTGLYEKTDLTPVIIDRNILADASSFENYAANTELRTTTGSGDALADKAAIAPVDDKWGVSYVGQYYYDNHFKIETKGTVEWAPADANIDSYYDKYDEETRIQKIGDVTKEEFAASLKDTIVPHSGDSMLVLHTKWRAAIRKLDNLTPNTNYTVTFYTYTSYKNDSISRVAVANTYDGVNTSDLDNCAEGVELLGRTAVSSTASDYRTWKKVTVSFNSGDNTEAYLHIHVNGTDNAANVFPPIFVDDLTVAESVTNYVGTAIRASSASKPQALRYKFQITNELIGEGFADWEVEEYGSIAIRTHYLSGKELTLDGNYFADGKERAVSRGVAYNKTNGTDIVFAKDLVNTEFTAALTGIGRRSDGSVNYAAWNNKYSVRNYIILKKGDATVTLYGEQIAVASVFAVMDTILNYGSTEDKAIVNGILNNSFSGADIRAAYEAAGYVIPEE